MGQSGSRIKLQVYSSADGAKVALPVLYDSMMETVCVPQKADDGVKRCLPLIVQSLSWRYLADPACTVPTINVPDSNCPSPAPRFARSSPDNVCDAPITIHPITGPLAAAPFETTSQGCVPATGTSGTFYAVGGPMPADAFVEADSAFE